MDAKPDAAFFGRWHDLTQEARIIGAQLLVTDVAIGREHAAQARHVIVVERTG